MAVVVVAPQRQDLWRRRNKQRQRGENRAKRLPLLFQGPHDKASIEQDSRDDKLHVGQPQEERALEVQGKDQVTC